MSMYQCEAVNELGKNEVTVMLLQILDDTSTEQQAQGGTSIEKEAEADLLDNLEKPDSALTKPDMSA